MQAYDVYPPSVEKAVAGGCVAAKTPAEAAKGAKTLGLMVVNVKQVEDVLLGEPRVADSEISILSTLIPVLPDGASIVVFSTCPPSAISAIQAKLDSLGRGLGVSWGHRRL